jgi:hypothetical protein
MEKTAIPLTKLGGDAIEDMLLYKPQDPSAAADGI